MMIKLNHKKFLKYKVLARKIALPIAVLILFVGLGYSLHLHPEVFKDLEPVPVLVLVMVIIPASLLLSVLELKILAKFNGVNFSFWQAVEITVVGSAANMLPLPGATMVRVAALKGAGVKLSMGTVSTVLIGFVWIGVAFLYAGFWLLKFVDTFFAPSFLLIGSSTLLATGFIWIKLKGSTNLFLLMLLTKLLMVILEALAITASFNAIQIDVSFTKASVLSVSGVIGSAVALVPAGLGIREGVTALLSPLVGISPAIGFITSFLNRVIGMSVLLPLAGLLVIRHKTAIKQ